jgi:perosamine synthetase
VKYSISELLFKEFVAYVKFLYPGLDSIPLHAPVFDNKEKEYVLDTIDSTFVSSVGEYVGRFESMIEDYTGAAKAIALVNGTSALQLALMVAGVKRDELVITQSLTFVATSNAVSLIGATPVFVDVDINTYSMCPDSLENFLFKYCVLDSNGSCIVKATKQKIAACIPVHIFGHPAKIHEIKEISDKYNLILIEDAAEALGSFYHNVHLGRTGLMGVLSFNGNKSITCGGGGAIITDDLVIAKKAKHLSTTGKILHKWEYIHDEIAFNFRMPNINAALGCAQLEKITEIIESKRELALLYNTFFNFENILLEPKYAKSNYWLQALKLNSKSEKDNFLKYTNENGVMTRPLWRPMHLLNMYKNCLKANLNNTMWLYDHIVNIPSSPRLNYSNLNT